MTTREHGRWPDSKIVLATGTGITCVWIVLLYSGSVIPWALRNHGMDFGMLYRAACSGHLYQPDPLSYRVGVGTSVYLNLNAPQTHLLVVPLCGLPLRIAFELWIGIPVLMFFGTAVWIRRDAPLPLLAWPALGLSAASLTWVLAGQMTGLLFPLVLGAWLADRRHRPFTAGALLGILAAMKPFFGVILMWWLLRGNWRALLSAVLAGGASFGAGVVVYGPEAVAAWVANLHAASWEWAQFNASLWAPWARAFGESPEYTHFLVSPLLRQTCTAISVLIVSVVTLRALHRHRSIEFGWAVCLTASLLLSPLGWAYYGWLIIPALLTTRPPIWAWAAVGAGWILPPAAIGAMSAHSPWLSLTVGSSYTWGLLAMWAGLIVNAPVLAAHERPYP